MGFIDFELVLIGVIWSFKNGFDGDETLENFFGVSWTKVFKYNLIEIN